MVSGRWLVTGSAGFVGRALVERLTGEGVEVAGFELRSSANGSSEPDRAATATLFEGDLLDLASLRRAVDCFAPDVVVHLGGLSSVGRSWRAMSDYFRVNVLGTENVLAAVRDRARVVLASSGEVYGISPPGALPSQESEQVSPVSPYALTKAAAERLVLREGGIVIRSFSLLGAGQGHEFALPTFAASLAAMKEDQPAVLEVGNLDVERDFLHVRDGVDGYRAAVERGASGTIYNLCSGDVRRLGDVLDLLVKTSGRAVEVVVSEQRLRRADIPCLCGNPGRLRDLGWRPQLSVEKGLEDLWREHNSKSP